MGIEGIITAVSMGLSLVSCIAAAVVWIRHIRLAKTVRIHRFIQDTGDDGDVWIIGATGRI